LLKRFSRSVQTAAARRGSLENIITLLGIYCQAGFLTCHVVNKYSRKASWQSPSGDSTAVAFIYACFGMAFIESTPTSPEGLCHARHTIIIVVCRTMLTL
jgi:hypothetical protein